MKVLVTGGAGFIGSNFIRYWLANHPQDHVVNFDKLTYAGHLSSIKELNDNKMYTFVKGDISSVKDVDNALKGVDIVVHFAAETHVDRSIDKPAVFVTTNVVGTHNLLEAAIRNGVKRFHHVSTDEVFGDLSLETKDRFTEGTPYNPHSPYSASKASSDHFVRAYGKTFGLAYTISNCANNYGPYSDPEKFIPRAITDLIIGEPIKLYGEGKNIRDWLYIEDHCRAIETILQKGVVGETYLIGTDEKQYTNLDIANMLLTIFGKDKTFIKFVPDRKGHDRKYAIDSSKLRSELGWKPLHNLEVGLQKTVDWYKNNEWWWKPLKEEAEKLYAKSGQK